MSPTHNLVHDGTHNLTMSHSTAALCVRLLSLLALFHWTSISVDAAALNSKQELQQFFKGTYIMKQVWFQARIRIRTNSPSSIHSPNQHYHTLQTGKYYYDSREKEGHFADGFNPEWAFYRFHHVCLRGGSDGIFVGMDGVQSTALQQEGQISAGEWNTLIGSKFNAPLTGLSVH